MHINRRLWRLLGVLAAFAIVVAACGDDDSGDDNGADDGNGSDAAFSLTGIKGTLPSAEAPTEFQERLLEVDPELVDFSYGPETYDAIMITALAAEVAGTDNPVEIAAEIVGVTKDGTECSEFSECRDLIADGEDIDYVGAGGSYEFIGAGEPSVASFAILQYGDDNRIDDDLTEYRNAELDLTGGDDTEPESYGTGSGASDGVLKIGTLLPETGSLAFLGPPEFAAAELAVQDLNEAGGVLDADVELFQGDSGDTESDIADQTTDRHLAEGVDVIVGAASSGVSFTVIDKIVAADVIQFSPANTSPDFTDYDDNGLYFRTAPSDVLQGRVLADLVADEGNGSVGAMALEDPYGTGLLANAVERLDQLGVEVTNEITYDPNAQNFDPEVDQVVGEDPEALILIGFEESARILTSFFESGFLPDAKNIYLVDGNIGNALAEEFD